MSDFGARFRRRSETGLPDGGSEIIREGVDAVVSDKAHGIAVGIGIKMYGVVADESRSIAVGVGVEMHGGVSHESHGRAVIVRVELHEFSLVRAAGAVSIVVAEERACRTRRDRQKHDRQPCRKMKCFHEILFITVSCLAAVLWAW